MSIFQRDVDASRGRPRKQINGPRSNINSIIETKRAGGVAERTKFAGTEGVAAGPHRRLHRRRMRVDVSAGLRRMNEGRRVMLPRYCTARSGTSEPPRGGEAGWEGGAWLPVSPPPPPLLSTPRRTTVRSFPQTATAKTRCRRCCIMCHGRETSLLIRERTRDRFYCESGESSLLERRRHEAGRSKRPSCWNDEAVTVLGVINFSRL